MLDYLPFNLGRYIFSLVPDWIILGAIVVGVLLLISQWRWKFVALLLLYVSLVLCHTVLFRYTTKIGECIIIPFWSYTEIFNGNKQILWEVCLNVLMAIPFGILQKMSFPKLKWHHVALISIISFSCIELLQLLLHRGLCETDDVIHNTLGTLIGFQVSKFKSHQNIVSSDRK